MNKMNRKVEYALMALKRMSEKYPGELTSAKEITRDFGAPFDAASRVMQVLAQKGLLKSEQGAHGGYQIIRDLSKVNLLELIEMLLGPIAIAKCLHAGNGICEIEESCNVAEPIQYLNRRMMEFYKSISVREIIECAPPPVITQPARFRLSDDGKALVDAL